MKKFFVFFFLLNVSLFSQERVSVMPFQNLTYDGKFDYISDGFSETLTTAFSQVGQFIVVERLQIDRLMTEFKFQKSHLVDQAKVIALGKMLGVQKIVIGSFQISNKMIRINTRIVNVETGEVEKRSAIRVDGKLYDIFKIQDEICQAHTEYFGVNISNKEKHRIEAVTSESGISFSGWEHYVNGRKSYAKGKFGYHEAIRHFEKAIEIDRKSALAHSGLALVYGRLARDSAIKYDETNANRYLVLAEKYASQAMQLGPFISEVYLANALVSREKKDRSKMMSMAEKALEIDPNNYEAYTLLGDAHSKSFKKIGGGDFNKAIEYYKKGLAINPRFVVGYINLGIVYNDINSNQLAKSTFEKAIRFAQDPLIHARLGDAYFGLKDYEKAKAAYSRALELDPGYSDLYNGIGRVYKAQGIYQKAIEFFLTCISKIPFKHWPYVNLIRIFNEMGEYESAKEYFNKGIQQVSNPEHLYTTMGEIYEQNKNYDQAIKHYKKALDLGSGWGGYRLGQFYKRGTGVTKDLDQMMAMFLKGSKLGDQFSQAELAYYYYENKDTKHDYDQAFYHGLRGANQGNAYAQVLVGLMYENGHGVEKDFTKAREWYERAVEQQNRRAQYRLGNLFYSGKGVRKSYGEAFTLFRKAVEPDISESYGDPRGNRQAQFKLGEMYENGYGVKTNLNLAIHWYKTAANSNDHPAMDRLIEIYQYGIGVPQNSEEAECWKTNKSINMYTVTVPCDMKDGTKKTLSIWLRECYSEGEFPGEQEARRLLNTYDAKIPQDAMNSFRKFYALAAKNGVGFIELTKYALERKQSKKKK